MKVPMLDVKAQIESCKQQILEAVHKVIDDCQFIMGPEVKELECKLAGYTGSKYTIGCASGTDALLLALRAFDIGAGDEVITTPYTFFATAGAVANVGAKPVFVDIIDDTFNIDPAQIELKITPKTKAVIPVHLFGQCADMNPIMAIAKKYNLKVIEDTAQSLGAKYKGNMAGTIGDIGCYSFFPSKNLGAIGDGGFVTAKDQAVAEKLAILRLHGSKPKYYHSIIGTNSRLDTIQAAVLLAKLPLLDGWAQKRMENAQYYNNALANIDGLRTPYIDPNCHHVFNQYTLRTEKRDELMKHLEANNIGCAIYYPVSLHLQKCFEYLGYKQGDFPISEKAARESVSIPVYPELTKDQMDYVIGTIKNFFN